MSISEVAKKSALDEEIVYAMTCLNDNSWSSSVANKFYPFRYELSAVGAILLRGDRVIIPTTLRQKTLELAHEGMVAWH